ncbi:MAG TPA: glycerol-3-phosphate dehydrogenase/oxidase [Candidatus Binatia bacterium]|nr:glycerol-3-phosphate dehydrogenase/oxidase [Candidatus Binatia bacterium]
MRRTVAALGQREYDVVIVGGGIFGICAAWEAASRGLTVALLERRDFAAATSEHCFKMIHGGLRYLQHGDLPRLRESSRERSILLRIAPHLVRPLPIVVPTYGHGRQSRALLRAGLLAYDALTADRNRDIADPQRRIPAGRMLSRQACLSLFPWLRRPGLTGAALVHDGHMPSPTRLALAFLKSATEAGAEVVNYVEATGLLRTGNAIRGVKARDALTGAAFDVRGRLVLNAAGPWAGPLLRRALGIALDPPPTFSRDAYLVVPGRLTGDYALAVPAVTRDPDAILSRGPRHLFLVPWRDSTLVGVWHKVHRGAPETVSLQDAELEAFLDELNRGGLPVPLTRRDIVRWHAGLVLFGDNAPHARDLSYGKRSRVVDHARTDKVEGLVTLIGVRYTTARAAAEAVIDLAACKLGRRCRPSRTAFTPIHGGAIERVEALVQQATVGRPYGLKPEILRSLIAHHGSAYRDVLRYVANDPGLARPLGESSAIKAQVVHAVREEMAVTLGDVVFRRTDLGAERPPGPRTLAACAAVMAAELGWSPARTQREIDDVEAVFHAALGVPAAPWS